VAKYIRFEIDPEGLTHEGKPIYWIVNKRGKDTIGQIFWYPTWGLWAARFKKDSVWSEDCLADVREFIKGLAVEK